MAQKSAEKIWLRALDVQDGERVLYSLGIRFVGETVAKKNLHNITRRILIPH
jgi:NAD-dependent DNA ligase